MKAIIFGINGQDGHYLKNIIEKEQGEIIGVSRSSGNFIKGDVADFEMVSSMIRKYQPDYVFHLAANSSIRHEILFENHQTISTGSLNILEAVYRYSKHTKVFLSGSGLQFINTGKPIKETDEFCPGNPYAVERIYASYMSRYYRNLGIKTYMGYFFHHDSPLRSERHLNVQIIKKGLQIKKGVSDVLEIGNPGVIKEFNFAGDMMEAVWTLVKQEKVFEAVIGSGVGYSILDWIKVCAEIMQFPLQDHVVISDNFKPDFEKLVSDPFTVKSLGWLPQKDIRALASLMIKAAN